MVLIKKIPFVFLFFCFYINSAFSVEIYEQYNQEAYGRTDQRDQLITRSLDSFFRSPVLSAPKGGTLTAVVVDREISHFLKEHATRGPMKGEGFQITLNNGIFKLQDNRYGLEVHFSLEKPNKEVEEIVATHYGDDAYWQGAVLERYKNNFIIRIWGGDSNLGHESGDLSFGEALLLATLLGDEYQWLWGIRDGQAYLYRLLTQWYEYNEELLRKQGLRLPYPSDGSAIPGFLDANNVFIPLEEKIPDLD